jgi:uncharacterized membrane protein
MLSGLSSSSLIGLIIIFLSPDLSPAPTPCLGVFPKIDVVETSLNLFVIDCVKFIYLLFIGVTFAFLSVNLEVELFFVSDMDTLASLLLTENIWGPSVG